MGWYFNQVHSTTPARYLRNSNMTVDEVWGGDIELMAISSILGTDVYVANHYNQTSTSIFSEVRWTQIRSSNPIMTKSENCIYISNYDSHYAPVCKLINSTSKTYFSDSDNIQETVKID